MKIYQDAKHRVEVKAMAQRAWQRSFKLYVHWLAGQAQAEKQVVEQELQTYRQQVAQVSNSPHYASSPFAPLWPDLSAVYTLSRKQILFLTLSALGALLGVLTWRLPTAIFATGTITFFYAMNLILSMLMICKASCNIEEEQIDDTLVAQLPETDWPYYTILCPLYRESLIVPQFISAMRNLDYPLEKLQVLLLTEADDHETREALRSLTLPAQFQVLTVPNGQPRTKPRACNYGLLHARGRYTVIYDAEDIPDPLQLKKAVLTFANHTTDVVCVQARLDCYNSTQNLLTRCYTAEYAMWFSLILPGLQKLGFAVPLGGTSNHFRTAVLRALGGWDAYNVTEDCDLGLRMARCRLRTVMLDSSTGEEATSQVKNWVRQRSRWIKGYIQTYLVHMRHPWEMLRQLRLAELFSLQLIIGSSVGLLFITPLMWLLLAIYIIFKPAVEGFYHLIFPAPIFYPAAACFVFGNFYYIFLYLLGCIRREHYHLLPWLLGVPCYWALNWIAAALALYELFCKPHFWQKTCHGMHLQKTTRMSSAQLKWAAAREMQLTEKARGVLHRSGQQEERESALPSVMNALYKIHTQPLPALSPVQKQAQRQRQRCGVRDIWFVLVLALACMASITACIYYATRHQILLYADAYSHLRIARSVFDSATPGLAQLGDIWLPLPHVLMFPFIWNDYLWHSGLAGSFVSMGCYVCTTLYVYLGARRLIGNRILSALGAALFALNPDILYLQSTPLSELVCICTSTMACYYMLAWIQEERPLWLMCSAAGTFLATLSRYDGWALFFVLLALVIIVGWHKGYSLVRIRGLATLFVLLGGSGMLYWLIWNKLISGDFLAFQHSQFSSQAQQAGLIRQGVISTYHNLWQALKVYTLTAEQTTGLLVFVLAVCALLWYCLAHRRSSSSLALLTFASPFAFYVLALYSGQAAIYVPGASPLHKIPFYNVRYGSAMVVPAALALTTLLQSLWERLRLLGLPALQMICVLVLLQPLLVAAQGVISLQDGQYGLACQPAGAVTLYLAQHYSGGKILEDVGAVHIPDVGMHFSNIIYDGSQQFWPTALHHPEKTAAWVILQKHNSNDRVAHSLLGNTVSLAAYSLVAWEPSGLQLYLRKGQPLPPLHPMSSSLLRDHRLCHNG
ncbi:glycosyltransferase [Ktedonosporobacter rubrisoli]|uniref:Glycosyltransferase n=1 Tax=Ktedonosporobacter rubrisoli TaxID=2509675 RepID=A0A4P6K1F6_KTERU|nr:glycosyltransferase [Ktedonosporobacter rubrisoli]QBD81500.1 glycosyltransferase [Ktedonosporobacter rubrisoli]